MERGGDMTMWRDGGWRKRGIECESVPGGGRVGLGEASGGGQGSQLHIPHRSISRRCSKISIPRIWDMGNI